MSKFNELAGKLANRPGVTDSKALAAAIGRKKFGKAGMAKKAAAGRKKRTAKEADKEAGESMRKEMLERAKGAAEEQES